MVFCTKKGQGIAYISRVPSGLNTGDRGSLFVALTLSSISMPSARDQLNSDEVATEVC